MGHGSYYLHETFREYWDGEHVGCFWVNIPEPDEYLEKPYEMLDQELETLCWVLRSLGYEHQRYPFETRLVWGKHALYDVHIGGHHDGNILVRLELAGHALTDRRYYNLAKKNHSAVYKKIAKACLENGLSLSRTAGAWCSAELTTDNIEEWNP